MEEIIVGTRRKKLLFFLILAALLYWVIFVVISGYSQHILGKYTQIPLVVIPIVGGLIGLRKLWIGGIILNKKLSSVIFLLSSGMVVWGSGLWIWTYYLFAGVVAPYPSLADAIFVWGPMLWIFGLVQLVRMLEIRKKLEQNFNFAVGSVMTSLTAILAYYLLVGIAKHYVISLNTATTMQALYDYIYTGEALLVVILLAVIWGFTLGKLGRYKSAVVILSTGFLIHFLGTAYFVQTVNEGTYFAGNIADLLFTVGVYFESLGIANLGTVLIDERYGKRK